MPGRRSCPMAVAISMPRCRPTAVNRPSTRARSTATKADRVLAGAMSFVLAGSRLLSLNNRALVVHTLDADRATVIGEPITLATGVGVDVRYGIRRVRRRRPFGAGVQGGRRSQPAPVVRSRRPADRGVSRDRRLPASVALTGRIAARGRKDRPDDRAARRLDPRRRPRRDLAAARRSVRGAWPPVVARRKQAAVPVESIRWRRHPLDAC